MDRWRKTVRRMRRCAEFLAAAAVLSALFLCACSLGRDRLPSVDDRPRVRDTQEIRRRLQVADASSPNLLLGEIGRISAGGFDAPVWRMAYRSFEPDLKRILVLAGTHGNHTAGVHTALDLIDRLAAGPASGWRCDMDIVPLVNPWGYVHGLDAGRDGTDLDRDFASFNSSEARVIRRFLIEKHYDLAIDLREGSAAEGFTLYQYGLDDTAIARRIADKLQADGYAPSREGGLDFRKPRDGILVAPQWGITIMRMSRRLSLAGYIRENVSPAVFAIETPTRLPLADRIAIQRIAVDMLIAEFTKEGGNR